MALSLNNSVRLLKLLVAIMKKGFDVELTVRCSILLLKNHWKYILSNSVSNNNTEESVLADIESLHQEGMFLMNQYRELVGVNLQGLKYLSHLQVDRSAMMGSGGDVLQLPPHSSASASVSVSASAFSSVSTSTGTGTGTSTGSAEYDLGVSSANTYDEYLEKRSELMSGSGGSGGGSKKKRKSSKGPGHGHENSNSAKKSK